MARGTGMLRWWLDWAPVLKVLSVLWLVLALFMLLPWGVLLWEGDSDAPAFARSLLTVLATVLVCWWLTWRIPVELKTRQMFVLTTLSWLSISGFASLPLVLGAPHLTLTNAVFESVSAITTTGSTILTDIDGLSDGLKLWRGLMQWLGGIGIIVMGIAILPFLKVGGMRLFQTESSDWSDKVMPRTGGIAKATLGIYVFGTLAATLAYAIGGMTPLDAVVHAMTSASTGGFANSDASFGAYADQPHLLWLATLFMLLGALPFVLYIRCLRGAPLALWRDEQVRGLLWLLVVVIVALTLYRVWRGEPGFMALTHTAFNVVSVVTTTGYASDDYSQWGPFAAMAFFYLTFVGGCSGSTSGGMKIFRFQVAIKMLLSQLRFLIHTHGVFVSRYNGVPLSDEISRGVVAFSFFFFLTIAGLALALGLLGLDLVTALTGAATAVTNVGPGLGDIIGPAGNFSTLPDAAKWLLCVGMLMGRLEILTVLVLLTPMFWRK
ncbi:MULTISPECIES: TrkH family potassium uptake protein [Halomonas]|uniref:TrkH family potassium uptake protein n=1 Tax=Halomonas TaxID=2745 RepID=UPI001A90C712|nr:MULTISPECIES: TrkH family potassium uptake protein [Halomonas]MBN8412510.1 TrkH family potassium uptake protein [Halomonas litopenaei]MBY5968746.1 TrkH family potassium uptake protein [Halomonas denitrificans]MBY6028542.1 TrkH family potassium uptake protein [Halomonas sp. DP8Y7-1]MED5294088.1 TrkH family potassium uptake protein [Pseudomonadota bacterium]